MLDLTYDTWSTTSTVFFVTAQAWDPQGQPITATLMHDPSISGANPYYWALSNLDRPGVSIGSEEQARETAGHASLSWRVSRVDHSTVKIYETQVHRQQTMKILKIIVD